MKCVSLIAKDLADATAIAERHGWTTVGLSTWRDEMGRLVTYIVNADGAMETREELVIVSDCAYERPDYPAMLQNITAKNVPAKYL